MESDTSDSISSSDDDDDELFMILNVAVVATANAVESDSDSTSTEPTWGGSPKGRARNIPRDFGGAYAMLMKHYFSGEQSVYNEVQFERRFGMPRGIVMRLWDACDGIDPFVQKSDRVYKRLGIRPFVRFVGALRMIKYGDCADRLDEHLQMSETVCNEAIKAFCRVVVSEFRGEYLNRSPTPAEKQRSIELMKMRGFPGCFGSWDCKHFLWRNCPTRLAGQYKGKEGGNTIIMEAICDPHLYIWYFNFGNPGSMNDINVLDRSSIIAGIMDQTFDTKVNQYTINGRQRDYLYFLADGIYPSWSIFAKKFPYPSDAAEGKYASRHEHVRKDIERAFGVLISRFGILERPLRGWYQQDLRILIDCCIIMHNMITAERCHSFRFNDLNGDLDEEDDAYSADEEEEVETIFPDIEVNVNEKATMRQVFPIELDTCLHLLRKSQNMRNYVKI